MDPAFARGARRRSPACERLWPGSMGSESLLSIFLKKEPKVNNLNRKKLSALCIVYNVVEMTSLCFWSVSMGFHPYLYLPMQQFMSCSNPGNRPAKQKPLLKAVIIHGLIYCLIYWRFNNHCCLILQSLPLDVSVIFSGKPFGKSPQLVQHICQKVLKD